ncbi:MAG: GDSL-type esterase/lipase family protein [Acidimicrobiales bacterium]
MALETRDRADPADAPRRGSLVTGTVLLTLGGLILTWAVLNSHVLWGVGGLALAALGMSVNSGQIRVIFEGRFRLAIWTFVVALIAGALLLVLALWIDEPIVAAIGVAVGGTGLACGGLVFRRLSEYRPPLWLVGGLAAVPLGLTTVAVGVPWPVGAVIVLLGLGAYNFGVANLVKQTDKEGWVLAVGTVVFFTGVISMGFAVRTATAPLGGFAAFLILISMIALAVSWPAADLEPLGPLSMGFIGFLFLLAGVFVTWAAGQSDLMAWTIALGLAGFGWSIVRGGEGVVIGVLIGFVLVWSLVGRTTDDLPDPHPDANGRIVALGDSYMSGEGATEFFAGTDQVGSNQNECRRAKTAYPYLVADELGMGLDFYACSGAVTRNIIRDGEPQMQSSGDETFGALVQLANLPDDRSNIELALVSIGGNDAAFSQIASGCLLPGTCDELRELWLGNVENIGPSIQQVYRELKEELPGVPIVAMPYPLMVKEEGCAWSRFDSREHEFLFEFVAVLNEQVRASAAQAGVNFFEEGLFAFEGEQICDGESPDDTVMNFLSLQPTEGDLLERINPQKWIHGSMHPKPVGHRRTADRLAPFVEALLASKADGGAANPEEDPQARFNVLGIRSPQPFPIDPADFDGADGGCGSGPPDAFATRVLVFDEAIEEDGEVVDTRVPAVPIADADAEQMVCLTGADGSWGAALPGDDEPIVDQDGLVFVTAEVPDEGIVQRVAYVDRNGKRRLRVLEFCSPNPNCPSTVDQWSNDQLAETARRAAPAVVLSILAGWLLAMSLLVADVDWRGLPRATRDLVRARLYGR